MPIKREFIKPLMPVDLVPSSILLQEGSMAQVETPGPHRDSKPAPSCLEAAGGKPEPVLPYRLTPRPVGCSGRNRGSGSLNLKQFPFWCQCHDCLETFSIEGLVLNNQLIRLEEHRRVGFSENGQPYHRCGGNGATGRLMIYPDLKFRSSP